MHLNMSPAKIVATLSRGGGGGGGGGGELSDRRMISWKQNETVKIR